MTDTSPDALPRIFAALQLWRDADHEEAITLSRDDVILLIEEAKAALRAALSGGTPDAR